MTKERGWEEARDLLSTVTARYSLGSTVTVELRGDSKTTAKRTNDIEVIESSFRPETFNESAPAPFGLNERRAA